MKTFKTMLKIESRLSVREIDMVIFALCIPVVMVFILGIVFGDRPAYQKAPYTFLEQSLGALSTIVVCTDGAMGLPLLVSDYRQKHTLERFQVTPISPAMVLAIYVTVYTAYSLISPVLVYANAALLFGYRMQGSPAAFLLCCILVMLSTFSTGVMVEGTAPNMKSASVAASVLYFPILTFSGATLPYEVVSEPMQKAAGLISPTQGIKLLEAVSLDQEPVTVWISIAVATGMFLLCGCISLRFFRWE